MDEYLDEEVEVLKQAFEMTCRAWEKTVRWSLHLYMMASANMDYASSLIDQLFLPQGLIRRVS